MISLLVDESLSYPEGDEYFSPDERFPEYPFDHISGKKNPVYRAVRNLIAQAGLDKENFGTPRWNPFRAQVPERCVPLQQVRPGRFAPRRDERPRPEPPLLRA